MGRCIVVTSGKGGVGKTTVTASLGLTLSQKGERVVLVDADITLNNLDLVLGLENKVEYDLNDVIRGKCRLSQALVEYGDNLKLLPSVRGTKVSERDFIKIVTTLRETCDFLFIDCPAGIDEGFYRAVSSADEAIVVTTPSPSALRDADKVVGCLAKYKLRSLGLIVNRARGDLIVDGEMLSPEEISKLLRVKLIGCLPENDGALDVYGTLPKDDEYFKAIKTCSAFVKNMSGTVYDPTLPYRGLWGGIKRLLKKV